MIGGKDRIRLCLVVSCSEIHHLRMKSSFVPGGAATQDEPTGEGEGDIANQDPIHGVPEEGNGTPNSSTMGRKRSMGNKNASDSPKGKKKKTMKDLYMKRLVEAYELKAQSSSATSPAVDPVRDDNCLLCLFTNETSYY